MRFGIPPRSENMMLLEFPLIKELDKVVVFGSRALGNYKIGSDIDLAVFGPRLTAETVNRLSIRLNEELPLPYYFDIVHVDVLSDTDLKQHIIQLGKTFYIRETSVPTSSN